MIYSSGHIMVSSHLTWVSFSDVISDNVDRDDISDYVNLENISGDAELDTYNNKYLTWCAPAVIG